MKHPSRLLWVLGGKPNIDGVVRRPHLGQRNSQYVQRGARRMPQGTLTRGPPNKANIYIKQVELAEAVE